MRTRATWEHVISAYPDHAQTMAFTTLMLFQMFNVFNARSDETERLSRPRHEPLALGGGRTVAPGSPGGGLHAVQQAFSTTALSSADWLRCTVVASSVLWLRELARASPVR